MGDFDRKPEKSGQKDQGKQMILMAVLGVIFVGVLGYHYMGRGPQAALAAPGMGGGIPMPVADETPEQASNALREDPTAALLRNSTAIDTSLNTLPRNPFMMSDQWRSTLIQEAPPAMTPVAPTVITPRPVNARTIPVPKAENFKLGSTIRQGGGYMAIINGRIVSKSAVVDDARVVDIQEGRVVLQHADHPDGPRIELTMDPKLK
jgi:hypothetical protein